MMVKGCAPSKSSERFAAGIEAYDKAIPKQDNREHSQLTAVRKSGSTFLYRFTQKGRSHYTVQSQNECIEHFAKSWQSGVIGIVTRAAGRFLRGVANEQNEVNDATRLRAIFESYVDEKIRSKRERQVYRRFRRRRMIVFFHGRISSAQVASYVHGKELILYIACIL